MQWSTLQKFAQLNGDHYSKKKIFPKKTWFGYWLLQQTL